MARYLTAAKIALLSLIELYAEGAVPSEGIIPVLSFVTSHILDGEVAYASSKSADDPWHKLNNTVNLMIDAKDFENLLMPLTSATGLPGRRVWDQFLTKLWAIDSLHALHEFFDRRMWLLAKTKEQLRQEEVTGKFIDGPLLPISRGSPVGTFLRHSYMEFARLPFHHVSELWKSFVRYREPTAKQWKRRHPQHGRLSFDSVLQDGEFEWGENVDDIAAVSYAEVILPERQGPIPVSTDEVESLLEFQIRQMQRKHPTHRWPLRVRALARLLTAEKNMAPVCRR